MIPTRYLAAVAVALSTAVAAAEADDATSFAIVNVRVFDGVAVLPTATVVVIDGKIAAVGPKVTAPPGVRTIDGRGKTLLPGLIDAHAHAYGDALGRALQFGVTTEIDMFAEAAEAAGWRREQAEGRADGRADALSAGVLATAPGGHGTEYGVVIPTVAKPDEAQAFVDARFAEGSDFLKIVLDDGSSYGMSTPTLDRPTLAALIAAAHARRRLAVVHIGSLADARAALESGADGLAHLFAGDAPDAAFASLARAKKAFVTPTLSVLESTTGVAGGSGLVDEPAIGPYLTVTETTGLRNSFPKHPGSRQDMAHANAAVRLLDEQGVTILAGSDAPNPGTAHGATMHHELALLVAAGLTPVEALAAATSAPARVYGAAGLADRGRIAPGLRADLLLVAGDPTTDIRATRNIESIWKAGHAVVRQRPAAPPAAPIPAGLEANGAISDFDEDLAEPIRARFGYGWKTTTDVITGGASTVSMRRAANGAQGSSGALEVVGTVVPKAAFPWAGVTFHPGTEPMAAANVSRFKELSFWTRGDGGTYQVLVFATRLGYLPTGKTFVAGAEWREVVFPLADFAGIDGSDLMAVSFTAGPRTPTFSFLIDQVALR